MKKIIVLLLITLGIFFGFSVFAEEKIDNFQTTIEINPDSSINVTENILYNFDNLQRHGIYRKIPIHYRARGGNFSLEISNISVVNENDTAYRFTLSDEGSYKNIKIGNSNQFISGIKTYIIKYKINRAINYFEDHDELYWNITGNEWEIPIIESSAKIILPETINGSELQADCFTGTIGATEKCNSIIKADTGSIASEVSFFHSVLTAGEGLTIVVGFPKDIVTEPSALQKSSNILWDNKIIFLPVLVFVVYFIVWWKKGRDPKGSGTIVAQYEAPDNLTPIEIGTLLDYRIDNRDLSAEIIYLATKGYLKITQIEKKTLIFKGKDYLLEALKDESGLENEFDQKLMAALFDNADIQEKDGKKIKAVKLSDIDKTDFQVRLISIKNKVKNSLFDKGYLADKPKKGLVKFKAARVLIMPLIWFVFIIILSPSNQPIDVFSIIATVLIVIIFSILMRKRTEKGVITRENVLGLKEYLAVAEADRIKFHNAPEKKPELFEKLLPYAMVFSVEKEWAKQFEDIYKVQPSWYEGPTGSSFNSVIFMSNLSHFTSSANSAIISASSGAAGGHSGFGGGGFSGGGGGGGGGGSW